MQQHKRTRLANREQAILTKFRRIEDRVKSLPENNHDLEYMPVQKRDKKLFFLHHIQDLCIGIAENMVKGAIKPTKINISNFKGQKFGFDFDDILVRYRQIWYLYR